MGLAVLALPHMVETPGDLGLARTVLLLLVFSASLSLPAGLSGTLLEGLSRFDLLNLFRMGHAALRAVLISDPSIFTLSSREDRFRAINLGAMGIIRQILVQGIDEGRFFPVDVTQTTEFIFSAYVMFIIKAHIASEASATPQMFAGAARIILRGLCKDPHDRGVQP